MKIKQKGTHKQYKIHTSPFLYGTGGFPSSTTSKIWKVPTLLSDGFKNLVEPSSVSIPNPTSMVTVLSLTINGCPLISGRKASLFLLPLTITTGVRAGFFIPSSLVHGFDTGVVLVVCTSK